MERIDQLHLCECGPPSRRGPPVCGPPFCVGPRFLATPPKLSRDLVILFCRVEG